MVARPVLHEVVESLLVVVALACFGGAVWVGLRGPRPSAWFFAAFLALTGFQLLDLTMRLFLERSVDVALSAFAFAALLFFVGHTPRRRGWMPTQGAHQLIVGSVVAGLFFLFYWLGGLHTGFVDGETIWFRFPVMLVGTLFPGLVAVLFLLDAQQATAFGKRQGLVWLALAFTLVVAHLAYRVRIHQDAVAGRSEILGPGEAPAWVAQFDAMVSAAYGGGLLVIGLAVVVAVAGLLRRRLPPLASGVYLVATAAAASAGFFVAGNVMASLGPVGAFALDRGFAALDELALATIGVWTVIRCFQTPTPDAAPVLPRPEAEPTPYIVPVELTTEDDARGDATRFHPRLGLDEPERSAPPEGRQDMDADVPAAPT